MDNWTNFKSLWASEFKSLTESDGVTRWKEFVDEVKHWNTLEECVMILSDQYHTRKEENSYEKMPDLHILKRMYFKELDKDKYQYSGHNCMICNNSGWVTIVMKDNVICSPSNLVWIEKGEIIGIYVGPCSCRLGDFAYPMAQRNACVANRFGAADSGTGFENDYVRKCIDATDERNIKNAALDGNI